MENQTQMVIVLPTEVEELAVRVSEQKQVEVNLVLNQIFAGTADWKKQAESIEVKGISDTMSIQLAEVGRKNVKTARLNAEKIFDSKRDEVQRIKSEYDLEDKLWLKAKQTAIILFKDIESTFEWKANFAKRFEAEQKELTTQLRIEKVSKFNTEINRFEFENMSNDMFELFLSGLEISHNDKIKAEQEAEAKRLHLEEVEKENARLKLIEDERIRKENEKLKAEAERKEKELESESKRQSDLLAKQKADADEKARLEREKQDKILADIEAKAKIELDKVEAERKRLESVLNAKQEAERKAKEEADKKEAARIAAEQEAAKAPRKQKLNVWIDGFILGTPTGLNEDKTVLEILKKFEGFKNWAKSEIEKL